MRELIQLRLNDGRLTPEVVAAFAFLHLATDDGSPITPAAHHWLWLDLMCDERIRKLLIIAPPESAKTTWVLSAYVGSYISFHPERSVIIGSTSGPVAEKRSMAIRTVIESESYGLTFPDVKPVKVANGLKWSTGEWSLAMNGRPHPGRLHPTIAAYGTGGSVIGSRADMVVADDLLDYDNSRTANRRKVVETWFHNSLLSRRKSRTGRAIVIGTAWHHDDLYAHSRKEGNWVVCHIPLKSDSENVFAFLSYPDNWPHSKLGTPVGEAGEYLQ